MFLCSWWKGSKIQSKNFLITSLVHDLLFHHESWNVLSGFWDVLVEIIFLMYLFVDCLRLFISDVL